MYAPVNIIPSSRICLIRIILPILLSALPVVLPAQESILNQFVILPDTACRLDTALNIIETATGYYFSYNTDIIPLGDTVKLQSPGDTLITVLRALIHDPDIQFRIVGNLIVITNILESAPRKTDTIPKEML